MIYTLTEKQYELGMEYSNIRYTESRKQNLNADKYSGKKNLKTKLTQDHQGSISEVVVANYLGLEDFVPSYNKFNNEPDIEPFVEVRSRIYNPSSSNSLLLRPSEKNKFHRAFVLVLFHCKDFSDPSKIKYEISGYIKGEEAIGIKGIRVLKGDPIKKKEDAYLIDVKYLKPMGKLKEAYNKLKVLG
jgi:hypothetical protein